MAGSDGFDKTHLRCGRRQVFLHGIIFEAETPLVAVANEDGGGIGVLFRLFSLSLL